ncbi:MAG: hypothetical protein HZB68_05290 [Candidatus Aenigmarchaeota archaeon]|nr:hypothetical protein [Candidatus Aenigmarchaeota archaeon]
MVEQNKVEKKNNIFVEFFKKIETEQDAFKTIKDTSNGFLAIGAVMMLFGIALTYFFNSSFYYGPFLDGMLYAVFGFFLKRFNSRASAVVLLLLSFFSAITTLMNKLFGGSGGKNIFLAAFVFAYSIRAVQATFALNKLKSTKPIAS